MVQDDDKILVAGSSGKASTEFQTTSIDIAIREDGKIILAGESDGVFAIARYNTTGSLDGSFGSGGVVTTDFGAEDRAVSVVIQDNQNLVVAGGTGDDFALARYLPDGSLDTSYGTGGIVTTDFGKRESIQTIALQPDGQIVAAGFTRNTGFPGETRAALARYTVSGALDTTFDSDGKVIPDLGEISASQDIVLQPDGKILVAVSHERDFASIRMLSDGSLDITYGENGLAGISVEWPAVQRSIGIQSDGKIVSAGFILIVEGPYGSHWIPPAPGADYVAVRYDSEGNPDNEFGENGLAILDILGPNHDFGNDVVAVQSDGKIIVAGTTELISASISLDRSGEDFAVVRYNADGTLDTQFGDGGRVFTNVATNIEQARSIAL